MAARRPRPGEPAASRAAACLGSARLTAVDASTSSRSRPTSPRISRTSGFICPSTRRRTLENNRRHYALSRRRGQQGRRSGFRTTRNCTADDASEPEPTRDKLRLWRRFAKASMTRPSEGFRTHLAVELSGGGARIANPRVRPRGSRRSRALKKKRHEWRRSACDAACEPSSRVARGAGASGRRLLVAGGGWLLLHDEFEKGDSASGAVDAAVDYAVRLVSRPSRRRHRSPPVLGHCGSLHPSALRSALLVRQACQLGCMERRRYPGMINVHSAERAAAWGSHLVSCMGPLVDRRAALSRGGRGSTARSPPLCR